jgi:Xaa-Pro aminopeptidase
MSSIAAGRGIAELDDAATHVLAQGMLDLRLLSGSIDQIIEQRVYRRYFPHRVSHWLGLDVHDAGDYALDGGAVQLESGMVLTVEPGIYIPAGDTAAPAALRGTGVRLEDDVLVTEGGPAVLTGALPIRAEDVERLTGG